MAAKVFIGSAAGFAGDRSDAGIPVVGALAAHSGPRFLMYETLAERTLAPRYALGALLLSGAFVAAWMALLGAAGVQFASMPWTSIASMLLWPLFLPLFTSALAPWSYSRVRHT